MKHPIASIVGGTRRGLVDMPWEEYLQFPALNGSVIVSAFQDDDISLLHLKTSWESDDEDSDSMRFGRMLHTLLFEHGDFMARWRSWDGVRRGKDYDKFVLDATAAGAEVVPAVGKLSMESALQAVPSFLNNAKIQSLIKAGQAEQSVFMPECGLQTKGRIDWISTSEHALVDLKTTRSIGKRSFGSQFFRLHYDVKLGLYRRWLNELTGTRWPVFVIALENTAPFDVVVYPIPDAVLDAGADKGLRVLEKVRGAIETDRWPGVAGSDYGDLFVPFYAMEEESEPFSG